MNLSRAHLGLSLCYFYLNDTVNAKANILKVLEIDPQKEVSSLFHPQTYVDLFEEVKRENEGQLGKWQPPDATEEPRDAQTPARPGQGPKVTAVAGGQTIGPRGGHWEIDFHYSSWSINLAKGAFEDPLLKSVSNEIREEHERPARRPGSRLPDAVDGQPRAGLRLRGVELRRRDPVLPPGTAGLDERRLLHREDQYQAHTKGPVTQNYTDGSSATVEGDAVVDTNPVTTHLSFRWDFVPSSRVTPYFIFGLGIGPLNGDVRYVYAGQYRAESQSSRSAAMGPRHSTSCGKTRTSHLTDAHAHAAFGVKAEVFRGVILMAEVGFWDGLILRGGLAFGSDSRYNTGSTVLDGELAVPCNPQPAPVGSKA